MPISVPSCCDGLRDSDSDYLHAGQSVYLPFLADRAIARVLRNKGKSPADFLALLRLPEHAAGAAESLRFNAGQEAYVARRWADVLVDRPIDAKANSDALRRYAAWAPLQPWPGRGGPNACRVLEAILRRAADRDNGVMQVITSTYALADDLAIAHPETIRRAQERLLSGRRLRRSVRGSTDAAIGGTATGTKWRIQVPDACRVQDLGRLPDVWASLGHDCFTSRGLRPSAWLTWCQLGGDPASAAALSTGTGQDVKTTRQALSNLADAGLSARTKSGWSLGAASLDEAAAVLGVTGHAAVARAQVAARRNEFYKRRAAAVSAGGAA